MAARESARRRVAHAELEHELAVLLRRARGVSGSLARDVHPGLDAAAYGLMARINDVGAARVTDLAAYFSVGKPTVSRQVTLLEQLGLVERVADDEDGRSALISLTRAGGAQLKAAQLARREAIRERLEAWSLDDVSALGRLLAEFNRAIGP